MSTAPGALSSLVNTGTGYVFSSLSFFFSSNPGDGDHAGSSWGTVRLVTFAIRNDAIRKGLPDPCANPPAVADGSEEVAPHARDVANRRETERWAVYNSSAFAEVVPGYRDFC